MPVYQYRGGLPVGTVGDPLVLYLAGSALRFECPGLFGIGRWSHDLPLVSIESIHLTEGKVLVVDADSEEGKLSVRLSGTWSDLVEAYEVLLRACPWVKGLSAQAAVPVQVEPKISRVLDLAQIVLSGILVLLVLAYLAHILVPGL